MYAMSARPWWKEPWPWMLIALPGSMVVISFWLLGVALHHSDSTVTAHPYEQGLRVGDVIRKARTAQAMHLWAHIDAQGDELTLRLNPPTDLTQLRLHLGHPFVAAHDRDVVLQRVAPGVYRGHVALDPVVYDVQAQSDTWSLSGRWKAGDNGTLWPGVSLPPGAAPQDE